MINSLKVFQSKRTCTIEEIAQIIGKLVAACPAVEYGFLYTKLLEREKIFALIINDYNYKESIRIPEYIMPELDWWRHSLRNAKNQIKSGTLRQ